MTVFRWLHSLIILFCLCSMNHSARGNDGLIPLELPDDIPIGKYIYVVQGPDSIHFAYAEDIPELAKRLGVRKPGEIGTGHAVMLMGILSPDGDVEAFKQLLPLPNEGKYLGGGFIRTNEFALFNPFMSTKAAGELSCGTITMNGLLENPARPYGGLIPNDRLPAFLDAVAKRTGLPIVMDTPIDRIDQSDYFTFNSHKHNPYTIKAILKMTYPDLEAMINQVNADNFPLFRQAQGLHVPEPSGRLVITDPNYSLYDTIHPGNSKYVPENPWDAPIETFTKPYRPPAPPKPLVFTGPRGGKFGNAATACWQGIRRLIKGIP